MITPILLSQDMPLRVVKSNYFEYFVVCMLIILCHHAMRTSVKVTIITIIASLIDRILIKWFSGIPARAKNVPSGASPWTPARVWTLICTPSGATSACSAQWQHCLLRSMFWHLDLCIVPVLICLGERGDQNDTVASVDIESFVLSLCWYSKSNVRQCSVMLIWNIRVVS